MRQHCAPAILRSLSDTTPQFVKPVPLATPPFDEAALQQLLAAQPTLLPLGEIDLSFNQPILLGREMSTPAGYIDLVFISPTGQLAFIETKLWKNPDARREVVVQVLDYAKAVSRWSFDDLNAAVRRCQRISGGPEQGILECVAAKCAITDESELVDNISRHLKSGRFLLVLVGEGIREGVVDLVGVLQSLPTLRFSFALVELALYQLSTDADWPLLIQPRIHCKTEEVVRAVIDIRVPDGMIITAEAEAEHEASSGPVTKRKPRLDDALFRDELSKAKKCKASADDVMQLIDDLRGLGLVAKPGEAAISMRLPDPKGREKLCYTVIVFSINGTFSLGWLGAYFEEQSGFSGGISEDYLNSVVRLTGAERTMWKGEMLATKPHSVDALLAKRPEFLDAVKTFINSVNAQAKRDTA